MAKRRPHATFLPSGAKTPKEITQHSLARVDDYIWLRYKEDPEVIKYLRAESDSLEEVKQAPDAILPGWNKMASLTKE